MKTLMFLVCLVCLSWMPSKSHAACWYIFDVPCADFFDDFPCEGNACDGWFTWLYCPAAYDGYDVQDDTFDYEVDVEGQPNQHYGWSEVEGNSLYTTCVLVYSCDSQTACTASNGFMCQNSSIQVNTIGSGGLSLLGYQCPELIEM